MIAEQDWFSESAATFGDRLAGAREAAGQTQPQLARRLGVTVKTLRAWEDDLKEPRANRVQMLSGLLNVSLTWLLTGEGDGLEGPVETSEIPADVTEILTELRELKADIGQIGVRMAHLEKKLRKSAEAAL